MKKKLVSMILCAAMAVSMVTGCGAEKSAAVPEAQGQQDVYKRQLSRRARFAGKLVFVCERYL